MFRRYVLIVFAGLVLAAIASSQTSQRIESQVAFPVQSSSGQASGKTAATDSSATNNKAAPTLTGLPQLPTLDTTSSKAPIDPAQTNTEAQPGKPEGPAAPVESQGPGPVSTSPESNPISTGSETAGSVPGFASRTPRYILRPGDVLVVTFLFAPEYNQTLPVQPDGFITLFNAGDLHVAGLDLPRLRSALAQKYSTILRNPQVDVVLKDFEKPFFIASGQLVRPGKYEMRGDTTVTEAVAIAGGFTDKAKHSQVLVFHHISADWLEAKTVDVKAILGGKRKEDVRLQPGDMLFVPQNRMSKIRPYLPTASLGTYVNPAQF